MTRFLNGPVLNLFLVAGIALPGYWAVHVTLTERGVTAATVRARSSVASFASRSVSASGARSSKVERGPFKPLVRVRFSPRPSRYYSVSWRRETTPEIIRTVFGRHGSEAVRVAWCESRFNPRAVNGDHYGIFQMGAWERATYGDAYDVEGQARAAHRYFVASGSDWSPWVCRP